MAAVVRNPDGTYTVTLTAIEQNVVTKRATKEGVNAAAVVQQLITRKLREWYLQYRERVAAARQDAYDSAQPSAQNTADTAIGFTPPEF